MLRQALLFAAVTLISAQNTEEFPAYVKPEEESQYHRIISAGDERGPTLPCRTLGMPAPTVRWFRKADTRPNTPSIQVQNNNYFEISSQSGALTLKRPANEEFRESNTAGVFYCTAQNQISKAQSKNYYVVFAKSLTRTDIPEVAQLKMIGDSAKLNTGYTPDQLQLLLSPLEKHRWELDGVEVLQDATHIVDPLGVLHLLELAAADFGVYTYSPKNTIGGSATLTRIRLSQSLGTGNPSFALLYPSSTRSTHTAVMGEPTELYCIYSGATDIAWSTQSSDIVLTPPEFSYMPLTIANVTSAMNGQSVTCTAAPAVSGNTVTYTLNVVERPSWKPGGAPQPAFVTYGTGHTFYCAVNAQPNAAVAWFINGDPMSSYQTPPGTSPPQVQNGNLMFLDVAQDQLLSLSCTATNSFSGTNVVNELRGSAYLMPVSATVVRRQPTNAAVYYGESSTVTLRCDVQVDSVFSDVQWEWYKDGQRLFPSLLYDMRTDSLTMSATLIISKPSTGSAPAGQFQCRCMPRYDQEPQPSQAANGAWSLQAGEPGSSGVTQAGQPWWLWLILALALIVIISVVLIVVIMQRRGKGQGYPVDSLERKAGHNPEKELKDAEFKDYSRPPTYVDLPPHFELDDDVKPVESDSDSMGEYGDLDTGKFNEDGSFIGQYGSQRKRGFQAARGNGQPPTSQAAREPYSTGSYQPSPTSRPSGVSMQPSPNSRPAVVSYKPSPTPHVAYHPSPAGSRHNAPVIYQPSPQSSRWSPSDTTV